MRATSFHARSHYSRSWIAVLVLLILAGQLHARSTTKVATRPTFHRQQMEPVSPRRLESDSRICFVENRGQLADQFEHPLPEVLYSVQDLGVRIDLLKHSIRFQFVQRSPALDVHPTIPDGSTTNYHRMDIRFEGANQDVHVSAEDTTLDLRNYYLAHCANGVRGVRSFHRLVYRNLYDGIDMVLYSSPGDTPLMADRMKYDFIVHPGADPSKIRMRVIGAESLTACDSLLELRTPLGFVRESTPLSYTRNSGSVTGVECRYVVQDDVIRLQVGEYSKTDTLIIDPPRLWGTYFGGSNNDYIYYVTADKDDNVIAAGGSFSSSGIASPGAYQTSLAGTSDAIIVKFGPDGTRKWSTYYGHSSGTTIAYGVTTDDHSNIAVVGLSSATSGIATAGAHQTSLAASIDGMIVKFDSNGVRLWGSYYGGATGITNFYGVCADSSDNLIATGLTGSSTGIATANAFRTSKGSVQCGFVVKFDANGARKWGTYISDHSTLAQSSPPAMDLHGGIYVCGVTSDSTGLATSGTYQPTVSATSGGAGFVLCFDSSGSRKWGTYVQEATSNASAQCTGVATDRTGHVNVVGTAGPYGGIATSGSYQSSPQSTLCAFVLQLDTAGQRRWGTYFSGTNGGTQAWNVVTDRSGDILLVGRTTSTVGLASAGEYQTAFGGAPWDCYFAKFRSNGSFRWATYYGGSSDEPRSAGSMDREGHPLLAGFTSSTSVFGSPGAFQPSLAGAYDGYIARFCDTVTAPLFTSKGTNDICYGESDTLLAGVGFSSYQWRKDGAALVGATSQRYVLPTNLAVGTYRYTVDVTDPYACQTSTDTIPLTVHAVPTLSVGSALFVCRGDSVRLMPTANGSAPLAYNWSPALGLSADSIAQPYAHPQTTTRYYLLLTDGVGCTVRDSILVTVNPTPQLTPMTSVAICANSGQAIGAAATLGTPPFLYSWTPATGLSSPTAAQPIATPATSTDYTETVTDANGCTARAVIHVTVNPKPAIDAGSDLTICSGASVAIGNLASLGTPPFAYSWSPVTGLSNPASPQPIATPVATTKYVVTVTDNKGCIATDSVTIAVNPLPVIDAGLDRSICFGDSTRIGSNASAGTGPYLYSWSPSIGLSRTDIAQPVASPASSTRFYVRVTDVKGCEATDSLLVSVNPSPSVHASKGQVICENASAALSATVTGGTPPYSYDWSPSATLSDPAKAATSATPHVTTTYHVIVTDANGCQSRDSVTVKVNPLPVSVILASGPTGFCAGDSVTLYPGGLFAAYFWSTGEREDHIIVHHSGNITVTVIDSLGCSATSAPIQVVESALPVVDLKGPNSVCPNATCSYSVTGTPGVSYDWSIPAGATLLSGQGTSRIQVQWTATGSWQLALHARTLAGCTQDTSVSISVTPELHPDVTPTGSITLCQGDTVILRASAGYSEYRWSNGASSDSIVVVASGTYTVTVKDDQGCNGISDPISVAIAPEPRPQPMIDGARVICSGDSVMLRTTMPFASYLWSTGASTPSITIKQAGSYYVTVTNNSGCLGTSLPVTLSVAQKPIVQISPQAPQSLCDGEAVTLSATPGLANYLWSTGDQTQTIVVSKAGRYSVTAQNADGCSSTSPEVVVTVKQSPSPSISGPRSVCTNANTSYSITPTTGSAIVWQLSPPGAGTLTGQGTSTVSIQWAGSGTAVLSVTETSNGCVGLATVTISIKESLDPTIEPSGRIHLCEGDSVTLHADRGYTSYVWNKDGAPLGVSGDSVVVRTGGTYTVFVTLDGACTGESQASTISVSPLPLKPAINRSGATLSTTPAIGYQWFEAGVPIPGERAQTFTPQHSGRYTVTIFSVDGCSSTSDPYVFTNGGRARVEIPPVLQAIPGATVDLPLILTDAAGLLESGATSFSATMHYTASLLAPQPLRGTEAAGVRSMVVTGPIPSALPASPFALTTLKFIATLGTDTCTDIILDTVYFPNADISVTYAGGEFCLAGVCIRDGQVRLIDPSARVTLSAPHPNPVSSMMDLDYDLAEDGQTKLYIQDLLGRTILIIRDEGMKHGPHSERLDLHPLPSGSYRVVLQTPTDIRTQRMEVLR